MLGFQVLFLSILVKQAQPERLPQNALAQVESDQNVQSIPKAAYENNWCCQPVKFRCSCSYVQMQQPQMCFSINPDTFCCMLNNTTQKVS